MDTSQKGRTSPPPDTSHPADDPANQQREHRRTMMAAHFVLFAVGQITADQLMDEWEDLEAKGQGALAESSMDLSAPITAEKITNALAEVAIAISSGQMEPQQGRAMLYAVQLMAAAHRARIEEEKLDLKQRRMHDRETPSAEANRRRHLPLQALRENNPAPGGQRQERPVPRMPKPAVAAAKRRAGKTRKPATRPQPRSLRGVGRKRRTP